VAGACGTAAGGEDWADAEVVAYAQSDASASVVMPENIVERFMISMQ
jgi:hypothetical protein